MTIKDKIDLQGFTKELSKKLAKGIRGNDTSKMWSAWPTFPLKQQEAPFEVVVQEWNGMKEHVNH